MNANIKRFVIFISLAALTSLLLSRLRHPFFSRADFNGLVLFCEALLFAMFVLRRHFRLTRYSIGIAALVGYAISAAAYVVTSTLLDRFGTTGLQATLTQSGLLNYVLNALFFSFFSYCWIQLPLSLAMEAYLTKRAFFVRGT